MNYYIFKIRDEDKYTDNLSFDKSITWSNFRKGIQKNDIAFVYIINTDTSKRKFICALNIDEVRLQEEDCLVRKKWDVDKTKSDEIIEKHYEYINSLQGSETLLQNQELINLLLATENK